MAENHAKNSISVITVNFKNSCQIRPTGVCFINVYLIFLDYQKIKMQFPQQYGEAFHHMP